ncbi:hypothetical protein KIW84_022325 [Lathyrus oleraceus]|uniref:Dihydropyrimidinase n=1 Tax=Pisum sativum TaxID=3888 RepID=A0A9D5BAZ8_PEA|nr:hypothetical protein KIW84_022325 [Pisum sativum]
MLGSGTNLVTTVIGFGMSATFIVFVCTRIICGRLRGGVESRMMYQIESRYDIEQFCEAGIGYGDSSCGASIPSSSKLLIKGGTVVNAHHQQIADVYIEDGVIVAVNPTITVGDEVRVIDATGKFVMPGRAVLAGGTTMHIDFAIPIDGSLMAGFKAYEKKAKKSCMDYGFHMAITKWDETVAREMELMVAAGSLTRKSRRASPGGRNTHIRKARSAQTSLKVELDEVNSGAALSRASSLGLSFSFTGFSVPLDEISSSKPFSDDEDIRINSFKFFMAYKGALMIGDELLLQGLKKCKSLGALAMVHAENGDAVDEGQKKMIELGITGPKGHALSRPPVLEGEATAPAIRLADFVNTPLYVVHVMSIDAMEEIAKARTSDPVISDALGGILVGLVTSHDGGVENVTFIEEVNGWLEEGRDARGLSLL